MIQILVVEFISERPQTLMDIIKVYQREIAHPFVFPLKSEPGTVIVPMAKRRSGDSKQFLVLLRA